MIYVPMRIRSWEDVGIEVNGAELGSLSQPTEGCIGFLPAYDSIEELRKTHPDAEYMTLQIRSAKVEPA